MFAMNIGLLLLVVYFDGSRRHPSDRGFPTQLQQPRAACGACIFVEDNQENRKRLFLGGKLIENDLTVTSGVAEYHGLIFALQGVQAFLGELHQMNNFERVRVLGDCKTVIHQMQGLSRPRKLDQLQRKAQAIVDEVSHQLPSVSFQFEHIPRSQNFLCDDLASSILLQKESQDYHDALNELDKLHETEPSSYTKHMEAFCGKHLLLSSNTIPFSQRPPVYRLLAASIWSLEQDELSKLLSLGKAFEREVRMVWSTQDQDKYERLLVESLSIQLMGMRNMNMDKKAIALERKHRYLMEKHNAVFKRTKENFQRANSTPLIKHKLSLPFTSDCRVIEWLNQGTPSVLERWVELPDHIASLDGEDCVADR